MSNSSLKHLLKYEGDVKPTSYAISDTLFSVFSNSWRAFVSRALRSSSTGVWPVRAFTFLYNYPSSG